MNELSKITAEHVRRCAIVYVRQSSTTQVEHNRESTARQYELAERAARLGWRRDQVKVIDEDLGISGSGLSERIGFARMTAEVGLGQVGIVLGLEVSRLARNNADWYRLLDLCGLTHTLIGEGHGIPGARAKRYDVRRRAACTACAAARWHPQQGRTWRTAPRAAGGSG